MIDQRFSGETKSHVEHEEFGTVTVCEPGDNVRGTSLIALSMVGAVLPREYLCADTMTYLTQKPFVTWSRDMPACKTVLGLMIRGQKLHQAVKNYNRHFLHADIKPENFVIVPEPGAEGGFMVKLIDLELSVLMTQACAM